MSKSALLFLFLLSIAINGHSQSIQIGKQIWSTKNLDVSTFRNGDIIQEARSESDWENAAFSKTPAWCYYENNIENGNKYGKLYNYYAVIDPRGLAPEGWHIPSEAEWDTLNTFLGIKKSGDKMRSKSGWSTYNGTDESGFSGLPGGCRYGIYGKAQFFGLTNEGNFWSTTVSNGSSLEFAKICTISNNTRKAFIGGKSPLGFGMSVRCIKDSTSATRLSDSLLTNPTQLIDTLLESRIIEDPIAPINNTSNETVVVPLSDSALINIDLFSTFNWRLFLRNTTLKPLNDAYYSYFTMNVAFHSQNSRKNAFRIQYENPLVGDIIGLLLKLYRTNEAKWYHSPSRIDRQFSSGLLGWLQIHNNVIIKKNFIFSPGISIAGNTLRTQNRINDSTIVEDPSGYWGLGVGPSVIITTDKIKGFRLDLFSNLDFAIGGTKTNDPDYPKPMFLKYGCSITHRTGIFCSARMNTLIDVGENHLKMFRLDISMGYTFKKSKLRKSN